MPLRLTLSDGTRSVTVGLRPDTAEYLLATPTVNPRDWRVHDLILAAWALAQQLKGAK